VRITETDVAIDRLDGHVLWGHHAGGMASIDFERDGAAHSIDAELDGTLAPVEPDAGWQLQLDGPNGLVIRSWRARAEDGDGLPGADPALAEDDSWLEMVPGAWSYQLPAEPDQPYPIPVWYRIRFDVADLPEQLGLLVDGFAGVEWSLHVNGEPVTAAPRPSGIDSQIAAVELAPQLRQGANLLALRLVVADATDGLLDLVKLIGRFRLDDDGAIAAERETASPAPWTEQGYPFLSGSAVYRSRVELPSQAAGARVFVEADAGDDVLEVLVDGTSAGVRLWEPYGVEITEAVGGAAFTLELRVANTAVNLLGGTPRPSGLRSAPRVVLRRPVRVDLSERA
jgi:hypothetical protein